MYKQAKNEISTNDTDTTHARETHVWTLPQLAASYLKCQQMLDGLFTDLFQR